MTVTDLWHHSKEDLAVAAGIPPCACGDGTKKTLYPTKAHGTRKQWRVHNRDKGREITKHFSRRKEAKAYDKGVNGLLVEGWAPHSSKKGKLPVCDQVRQHIGRMINPDSQESYTRDLTLFIEPFFKHRRLMDIDADTIADWKAWMARMIAPRTGRPYAPTTLQRPYVVLSTALKDAVRVGKILRNPMDGVGMPKAPDTKADFRVWENELVLTILNAIPDREHAIALAAATSGHRSGEAFAIAVQDIGEETITIRHQVQYRDGQPALIPPKRNSVRTVGMHPGLEAALKLHVERYPTIEMECQCADPQHRKIKWKLLFHHRAKPLLSSSWTSRVWYPTLTAIKFDGQRSGMHQLRHHAASSWLAAGMLEQEVAEWLGHKSTKSTQVYTHLLKQARAGRKVMAQLYEGQSLLRAVPDSAEPAA